MFNWKKGFFFFLISTIILFVLFFSFKNLFFKKIFVQPETSKTVEESEFNIEVRSSIPGLEVSTVDNFKEVSNYWNKKFGLNDLKIHYFVNFLSSDLITLDLGNTINNLSINNLSIPTTIVSYGENRESILYAIGVPQKDEVNSSIDVSVYISREYFFNESIDISLKKGWLNELIYEALIISSKQNESNFSITDKYRSTLNELLLSDYFPFEISLSKDSLSKSLHIFINILNKLFSFEIVGDVYAVDCCRLGSWVIPYNCLNGNSCSGVGSYCSDYGPCLPGTAVCQDIYEGWVQNSCNVSPACCVGGCKCSFPTPTSAPGATSTPTSPPGATNTPTTRPPTSTPTCAPSYPGIPTLSAPASGTTVNVNTSVVLNWNDISSWGRGCPNVDEYRVCVSKNQDPEDCDYREWNAGGVPKGTSQLSWTPTIGTSLAYWRVASCNGAYCSRSAWRNFCVENQLCTLQCGQPKLCGGNCPIDETLTNCSSTLTTQYTETPQTTGTVLARATNCGSQVSNFQFPTWNNYNGQDDIVWYNATNQGGGTWQYDIPVASHQPLLGNPIIVHAYDWGCNHTTSNKKYIGATSFSVVPKTCTVTINTSGSVSSQTTGINITATGNAHINPGSDTVRVWITRSDMGVIPGGVTYDYGSSSGLVAVEYDYTGKYYSLSSAYQNSVDAANTSATFTVHAPPGNYRVHCDLPNDLNGNLVKCSGNPTCSFNGGSADCASTGWKSCSSNDWAPFRINAPPTFTSLIIKNADSVVAVGETGGTTFRNHICQTTFQNSTNQRRVLFEASVNDPDGASDISINGAVLTWNGKTYPMTKVSSSGTGATMRATVDFSSTDNATGVYDLFVTVTDIYGVTTGPVNTLRDWKVWDCQVPTSGTLYNGSAGQSCPGTGFSVPIDGVVGFNSILFSDTPNVTMTDDNLANYGPTNIVWGKMYHPRINGGTSSSEDGTLLATGRVTRITDVGAGTAAQCPSSQFTIGSGANALISAYSASPRAQIDFSFIRDQEAWYQVVGAGVKGRTGVQSGVPVTALQKALTLSGINNVNGLVASGDFIANNNGCSESTCLWGSPNNWYLEQNTNNLDIYNYNYFYNNFYVKSGIGKIKDNSWGDWATNQIYFVNESLNIKQNLSVPNDETMMVIVSGDIIIDPGVTQLDGIYIADGEILAGGINGSQLVINGMLYAGGDIRLYRSFVVKRTNNTTPAVKVNYSPGLIFNLPPEIMRVLSGWREE